MAKVLIVDDDKFTRSVLQTALAQDSAYADLDIETHVAVNGREGMYKFREVKPDAVIVDLLMPEVDGFALCKNIRDTPEGADIHLLCMSGIYRDRAVVQRVKDEYVAEFFAKPYQLRDLIQHLAKLLELDSRGEDSRSIALPLLPDEESRSGVLAERPLPSVLFDLLEAQSTGVLTLKRGRIRKTVDLVVGHPRNVTSTARDETLGHFLVTFGALTHEQHKAAVKRAAKTKRKLTDVLISLGFLTPEEMVQRLTTLTSYKLMQSLRWPEGRWKFEPAKTFASGLSGGNPIDMVTVVLQGLKRTASLDTVPERVVEIEHHPLELNGRGRAMLPSLRQHLSEKFANSWENGDTVHDLIGKGVERGELFSTLEALLLCDALDVRESVFSEVLVEEPSTRATGDFSVEELSEIVYPGRHELSASHNVSDELFDALFDDVSIAPSSFSDIPIALPDDAPDIINTGTFFQMRNKDGIPTKEETNFARRILLREYLRIQALDHYGVIKVPEDASNAVISAALESRRSKLSLDWFGRFDLGRDYAKLEEIHAAYERAGQVLLDANARIAYDKSRSGDDQQEFHEPALDAEIAYHAGLDLLEHGSYQGAIDYLQSAISAAPDVAEYHAILGWANYLDGGRTPRAADAARPHLNQGLAINPDHALSHEYKGIISAELGTDESEAIFHLERALDADASRPSALEALEQLWFQRGEFRPLERQYRRMIYRSSGIDPDFTLVLWRKLAMLYLEQLNEPDNARIAYESAARLAPDDTGIRSALAGIQAGNQDRFVNLVEELKIQWRANPTSSGPGLQLLRLTLDNDRHDAAFMVASVLVARGLANDKATELYERYKPRFVIRAQRRIDREAWDLLRHEQDMAELNDLFEILDPVIETSFPFDNYDLDVDMSMEVPEDDLTESFVRVRAYIAHMLDIDIPKVVARPDFGHQIHVGAIAPPVLLAGDDVLTSPERLELSFRLGRAMAYLLPGHTFAGSRPTRLLKAAVLALFSTVHRGLKLDDPQGHIARVTSYLDVLTPEALAEAQALVVNITQKSPSLNLSIWSQALGQTANRLGMILCGDVPRVIRFCRDGGTQVAVDDLLEFAISQPCWSLRNHLALSINV